jgi:glycine/D-amino acid oxidase-like deaminating enzyme
VGAGVFGAWTAWHLARAGKRVLLVDAWGAAHSRASSGGETRILRVGYGADEIYTRMAMRSREMWLDLFARSGQDLFLQSGALRISHEDDAYSSAMRETLARAGAPHEIVSQAEIARRWPQMRLPIPGTYGFFEPESGALLARRAVEQVVADAIGSGADFEIREVAWPNASIDARVFVFACGPWLPKLFPEILARRIFVTRQEVFFFAPPAGDRSFTWRNFPVWTDFTHPCGPYGFPDIESRGVKLAFDRHGEPFDPDQGSRAVTREGVEEARSFLAERFPRLVNAPLTESRVCQYANTSNGDFLIDRHPHERDVWLLGGGSGHGFKHGPAVGRYAAAQLLGTAAAEPRFGLETKAEIQRRTVF